MGSGAGNIYANTYGSKNEAGIGANVPSSNTHHVALGAKTQEARHQVRPIEENARHVDKRFELHEDGYFCSRGTGRDESFRQYESTSPKEDALEFFESLGSGGKREQLGDGMLRLTLEDSTSVVFREVTRTPGSPAVNIGKSLSQIVKNQKIHFVEKS